MSSRDAILGAIRAAKPAPRPRPDIPRFDQTGADSGERLARFVAAFKAMGGTWLEPVPGDPLEPLREKLAAAAVVVSRVPELVGTRELDLDAEPASLDDVDMAVVRAAFGVAETGSVAFTEAELGVNTLAYLAQHLVVLLDPADIVADIHAAYLRPEFARAGYLVFHTGPSATADIEGVLIRGAQGVRSLSILPLARGGSSDVTGADLL